MALDNPSYFSLAGAVSTSDNIIERGGINNTSGSGTVLSNGPVTGNGRTFAAFFRKRTNCSVMVNGSSNIGLGTTMSTQSYDESDKNIVTSSTIPITMPNDEIVPMIGKHTNSNNITNGQRKSFRNLFRSFSANAESEITPQILKGEPRPADVEPPSRYLPHRSHSHSERDRGQRPGRRRILKSASELLSNDTIYSGLPVDEPEVIDKHSRNRERKDDDDDSESAEVFLGLDDARYYNISSNIGNENSDDGTRRHSIGTFLGKDGKISTNLTSFSNNHTRIRVQTTGFIKEPDTMAPPIPTIDQVDSNDRKTRNSAKTNRRCRRHKNGIAKGSRSRAGATKVETNAIATTTDDHDDVIFVSSKESEASALWVNYLSACFEQISRQQGRPPFRVRHVTVEDTMPAASTIQEKIGKARLQIIVVCPGLLDRVTTRPEQAASLARQLSTERVLAMMLGVHDGHLTECHKSALINYNLWRKFFVKDQDETFVGEFLGAAVAILGSNPPTALKNDKTTFSVHPKKVKMGQNRIIAILNDPLRPEDSVDIIVDRCGEAIDITHVKRRNPYVLQFSIPDRCLEVSMLVGVRIMINGCPQGVKQVKCESRLRELDQILRAHDNPLEFMCQTFGFNAGDREQLDNWMVHAFQKNLPPRFDLLSTPSGVAPLQRSQTSPEENPTLLHFAARFGLEKLAWQLLECPGGDVACDLKNVADLTPADLAEQAGHARLAHHLRGYMQMNEFTNMYSYLKVISESTANQGNESANPMAYGNSVCSDNENDKEDYCRPRPLSEAYSVPPAARPITVSTSLTFVGPPQLPPPNPTTSPNSCEMNYSVLPPPTPVLGSPLTPTPNVQANGLDLPLQGYLKMHPAGPKASSTNSTISTMPLTASMTSLRSQLSNNNISAAVKREEGASTPTSGTSGITRTPSNNGTKSREPSGPQDELLEIINDFKNNVFTIAEVERLVETWRNRNDVQQSFKDKQRQLTAMRDEYERIQKKIKDELKAPSPFDRIKKFFTKGKKESKETSHGEDAASTANKTESASGNLADRRPISSLSLHSLSSSSSSGRMSIISGCSGTSLGDSGTHSDTEDRRVLRTSRDDKGGIMTYEIPPAPKPFTGRYSPMRYTPSPRCITTKNETDNRPTISSSQTSDSEHYIAFPVSGLPIHSFQSNGTPIEPKTPNSPCDQPVYLDLTDKINEIPELSEKCDENKNKSESSSISLKTPLPPIPPGMCIPKDYVNILPVNESSINSSQQTTTSDSRLLCEKPVSIVETIIDNRHQSSSEIAFKDKEMENSCQATRERNDPSGNSEEYVQADNIDDNNSSIGIDVIDSSRLPEYMNIGVPNEQDIARIVGAIPKKMPAPPVPPRGDSSLGH